MDHLYISKVMRIGTSQAIVIPVAVRHALSIDRGDYMIFAVYSNDTLTARKLTPGELQSMKPLSVIT